ncbi:lasso peptide biosynthesis B2 protein [Salinibacter altiplanensis]|uniref:lasso peptide biosynthesis B2 protein n=1 Tax=Salinibacter altiplanensis TaxID=1803181 RepID=UPI000C9ED88D|nr:lasso peptide biosynthesis B2 protein [Salinibacter altiplanensis]
MNVIVRTFRKLWQHPWQNWGLLLHAAALTVGIRTGLAAASLSHMTRGLRRVATGLPQTRDATPWYRRRAAWAAHAVGRRLLPERPCLTQALVLQYLLLRRGDDAAELHIGVTKDEDDTLQAHAWVKRKGHVLIGGMDAPGTYERFEDLGEKMEAANAP